jgi:hypothetical protein
MDNFSNRADRTESKMSMKKFIKRFKSSQSRISTCIGCLFWSGIFGAKEKRRIQATTESRENPNINTFLVFLDVKTGNAKNRGIFYTLLLAIV